MPVLPNSALPGNSTSGSLGQQIGQSVQSSLLGSVGFSNATFRQNVADMFRYSQRTNGTSQIVYPDANKDWRVRLSLAPGSNYFYNDPSNILLRPLISEIGGGSDNPIASAGLNTFFNNPGRARVGVVFPYTPSISVTHTATYTPTELTHSNYKQYNYNHSEVQPIQITADFTVQNVNEGQYLLACIYFFRSVTKMFFGNDPLAGNPPPVLFLNGYGQYYFPNVPCVVTSFMHTMPADVDYMDIPEPGVTLKGYNPQASRYRVNSTRMPTTSSITLTVQPIYSRRAQSVGFSLNDFARGAMVNAPGSNPAVTAFGASTKPNNGSQGVGGFI
jgi:hypothetical protein